MWIRYRGEFQSSAATFSLDKKYTLGPYDFKSVGVWRIDLQLLIVNKVLLPHVAKRHIQTIPVPVFAQSTALKKYSETASDPFTYTGKGQGD